MAKTYSAARGFSVGGSPATEYAEGDSFPASSPHVDQLLSDGYIVEGKHEASTGLSPEEQAVYEENEGSVADVAGNQIDVVGFDAPSAEEVTGDAKPARKTAAKKKTAARKSTRTKPRT